MTNLDGESALHDHTVFIDTSLDTHMATVFGEVDTVYEFKRKIQYEHVSCFPDIGEININALQVKRRGFLYHLSDSMFVKSAFDGIKGRWFLHVDARRLVKHGVEISVPVPGANGILRCLEQNGLMDRVDDQLNEREKTLLDVQNGGILKGKKVAIDSDDPVRKVLQDLENIVVEHCRASSFETNKRVEAEVNGSSFPCSESGQEEHLSKKRKADDTEIQIDKTLLNVDILDGHDDMTITAKKKRKIQKKENGATKRSSTKVNNSALDTSDNDMQNDVTDQDMTATINSAENKGVDMLESENEARHEDARTEQNDVNCRPIGPTNEDAAGGEALRPDPVTEPLMPDLLLEGVTADSSFPEVTMGGRQSSESNTNVTHLSEAPIEKSESNTKQMKKKKTKAKALHIQLPTTVTLPAEDNEEAPLESQKPACSKEIELKASDVLHHDVGPVKSGGKAKKEKKSSRSVVKKKTKTVTVSEETTKDEELNRNPENIGSNLEMTNISNQGSDRKTDEVAGSDVAEKATEDTYDMDGVRGSERSDMLVVKESSSLENLVPAAEKGKKKSKRKRTSASNPSEIQLKEKVPITNATQSTNHTDSREKSVEATADGLNETIHDSEKNDGKEAAGTVLPEERKNLGSSVGTATSVDNKGKRDKLSSATNEMNFIDYFVPRQHKTEAVASGDAGTVNEEWTTVKGKTEGKKAKKKSKDIQNGKKSEVESSQESLLRHQPDGAVLHSDTESFKVPKNRVPQLSGTSGKQKLKSSDKRSKPCGSHDSEVAGSHSPSASDAHKSKFSHKGTKLDGSDSTVVPAHLLNKKADTFTAPNSTFKTPGAIKRTKSKQLASQKSSTAGVKKAENAGNRRKTLLSTNIFKDDNDESSEDDEAVDSGPSAGTTLDHFSASEVSEMEDDTGFNTPRTVGQRKAVEADNDATTNEYTLQMLRTSTRLERAKRFQESESQLDEFVPDSQANQNL
uniref:Uncharacterized protein n=1 Tax=Kalanchoe fedtschenkoi TaxID=63787 RepID=A0A7N0TER2_KALFE